MNDAGYLDDVTTEARRALARFIRENGISLYSRDLIARAFALGWGIGVEVTATKFADDFREMRENYDALRRRVETLRP